MAYTTRQYNDTGPLPSTESACTHQSTVTDVPVHTVVVHSFVMSDLEDPDLHAAQPLWDWQNSEVGRWVMEHSVETPQWHRQIDHLRYGYEYRITARLKDPDYVYYLLRWQS